jgi:hypothetical protein
VDYEELQTVQVVVVAQDQGHPALSGNVTVNITVQVRLHTPYFTH